MRAYCRGHDMLTMKHLQTSAFVDAAMQGRRCKMSFLLCNCFRCAVSIQLGPICGFEQSCRLQLLCKLLAGWCLALGTMYSMCQKGKFAKHAAREPLTCTCSLQQGKTSSKACFFLIPI